MLLCKLFKTNVAGDFAKLHLSATNNVGGKSMMCVFVDRVSIRFSCHMTENNHLNKIISFIFYIITKFHS